MRIRDPKTTALIFASGKMVVTGAKSEDDSKLASRKYARIIQKLGFNAKFTDFKIQNIVGSCDIKFPIRLEGLASKHHPFSSYEPELFPGLIYRMIKPKIVLLIFVSGKIVLTGAKVREEIYAAFEQIYPTLSGQSHSFCIHVIVLRRRRLPQDLRVSLILQPSLVPTYSDLLCTPLLLEESMVLHQASDRLHQQRMMVPYAHHLLLLVLRTHEHGPALLSDFFFHRLYHQKDGIRSYFSDN